MFYHLLKWGTIVGVGRDRTAGGGQIEIREFVK
ncbi:hypothetical protein WKT22_01696 [Candidatus Lokiarchaeum ossiferum]